MHTDDTAPGQSKRTPTDNATGHADLPRPQTMPPCPPYASFGHEGCGPTVAGLDMDTDSFHLAMKEPRTKGSDLYIKEGYKQDPEMQPSSMPRKRSYAETQLLCFMALHQRKAARAKQEMDMHSEMARMFSIQAFHVATDVEGGRAEGTSNAVAEARAQNKRARKLREEKEQWRERERAKTEAASEMQSTIQAQQQAGYKATQDAHVQATKRKEPGAD